MQVDPQGHQRVWNKNPRPPATFWSTTTPNLRTLYVIDWRTHLRTGASILQGTPEFKGTSCTYVEVKPADNKVWVYPRPDDMWGTSAFTFAATLWEAMMERGLKMVTGGGVWQRLLADGYRENALPSMRTFLESPHRRTVVEGRAPECKS